MALGWFGPLFWPYAYYDLLDYIYWPYAYDDFWPYAYDDVYYGIYGPYAYSGAYGYRPSADPNGYYTRRSALGTMRQRTLPSAQRKFAAMTPRN